eukprot:PhM_4_TR12928/c0_g1_i2/m.2549/K07880/RAB4B; Ras-related protein Rab-4B
MAQKYDEIIKIIIIGEAGTGKSCLLQYFLDGTFHAEQTQTIGVEFGAKVVSLLGKRIKLQVWDTAGQERYRSVTRSYYRGAAAVMLVYDKSKPSTFESASHWVEEARRLITQDAVFMLVGNKNDVEVETKVPTAEAAAFAQDHDMMFLEGSAKTGDAVEEAFLSVAKRALQNIHGAAAASSSGQEVGDGSNLVQLGPTADEVYDSRGRRLRKVCQC